MPVVLGEFNHISASDIVDTIDALVSLHDEGRDTNEAMLRALDMLDKAVCKTVSDAVSLLRVSQILLGDAIRFFDAAAPAAPAVLAAAHRYQQTAVTFLCHFDTYERAEAIRAGATIN